MAITKIFVAEKMYTNFSFPTVEVYVPQCVSTPEFIHAAMRPDVITETVVEVSTEDSEPMDTSPIPISLDLGEPMKKKKGSICFRSPLNLFAQKCCYFCFCSERLKERNGGCHCSFHYENASCLAN